MKKIEVILKVTDACNLRCKYCYNSEKAYVKNCLPLEQFEKFLNVLLTGYNLIHIIWHGGEPLCAGIDYFRKAMDVERRVHIQSGVTIENSIQTNGTLINREWIQFFKEHDFRVGISFDGIENEAYRGQTDKTLRAMDTLRAAGLRFGCNAVVSNDAYDLKANYRFFKEKKISFEFSPLLSEGGGKSMPSTGSVRYAQALCDLFDEWIYDVDGVSVRTFSLYLNLATGGRFRVCTCASCHLKYLSITPDGTVYNCGRDSVGKYPFGKIDDFENTKQIFASEGAKALIGGSVLRREKCKASCEYFGVCAGGCADIAIMENGLENMPTDFCHTFKTVYKHVSETFAELVKNNTPLSQLNPAVKAILAKNMAKMTGTTENDLADTYV
ncbi:MAG: radical SAM protein [Oscillospiraceae bacterium]|nr:radical SAM protein [Oscillospiraceae bacterium]